MNLVLLFCIQLIKRQDGSLIDPFACELGRQLTRNTNYKVLPSRTMFPEDFQHPPESIGKDVLI
jgi:hypothetical protein